MSQTVSVHEAKTRLSQLIAAVEAGEEVIIRRGQKPVARLLPLAPRPKRVPGAWKGLISATPDAFAPLSEEEISSWEGDGDNF